MSTGGIVLLVVASKVRRGIRQLRVRVIKGSNALSVIEAIFMHGQCGGPVIGRHRLVRKSWESLPS